MQDQSLSKANQHPKTPQSESGIWRGIWADFRTAMGMYSDDHISTLGAALSYYTLFSLAPLLLIVIAITGFVFGQDAARGQVAQYIQQFAGPATAQTIQDFILR